MNDIATMKLCTRCGEPRGGPDGAGYLDGLCWPCAGLDPLSDEPTQAPAWAAFRRELINGCENATGVFEYGGAHSFGTRCPRCRAAMGVFFHGETFDVEFFCASGCVEREIAEALFGGER